MPDWDPDVDVTPELARRLIDGQLPELAGRPLEHIASGWDNAVFLVDGAWAVRFPRRAVAVPGVRREIALLKGIAPRLPLPIPVPRIRRSAGRRLPLAILRRPLHRR